MGKSGAMGDWNKIKTLDSNQSASQATYRKNLDQSNQDCHYKLKFFYFSRRKSDTGNDVLPTVASVSLTVKEENNSPVHNTTLISTPGAKTTQPKNTHRKDLNKQDVLFHKQKHLLTADFLLLRSLSGVGVVKANWWTPTGASIVDAIIDRSIH